MKLLPALRRQEVLEPTRDAISYSLDEFMGYVNELIFNGVGYVTYGGINQTAPGQTQEQIGPAYKSLASLAYKSDGVVFACMLTRALHFSEVRFQFRQLNDGRPGKLFGTQDLQPLEVPWVGGTTGDLLTRMLLHADLAGNAFVVRRGDELDLLRPDWVTIVIASNSDPDAGAWASDARVVGYVYNPGGYGAADADPEVFTPDEVAHFAPIPDPEARFRGMSWVTPLLREIMADKAGVETKLRYWENPTPNMVVRFDVPNLDDLKEQIAAFKTGHEGARNAFKYMFGTMGMDATPVGSNMKDLDFKLVMGAGETRIAAAARTPPVIVGLSEGLQGSALNSGNYQAARRMFADGCIRPLWRNVAASLANIITVPGGAELWYDERDVAFLKEDLKERADVMLAKAQTVRFLVDAGYKPDTVIDAVETEDLSQLEHSGLFSVQLQAATAPKQGLFQGVPEPNNPATDQPPPTGAANGNGNGRASGLFDGPAGGRVFFTRLEDAVDFAARLRTASDTSGQLTRSDIQALIAEHARAPEITVRFDEGAFQFDVPSAPDVHIHEGAFRADVAPADVRVEVESPVTRFEPGAIQVEAPEVRFDEGAFRTTVEPAQVHVDAPEVRFEEGAIRVDAPPAANVEVSMDLEPVREGLVALADAKTEVRVDAPVTVHPAEVEVVLPERAIEVAMPETQIVVNVPEQPAPTVNVNVPEQPAPVVNVQIDDEPVNATVSFKRNPDGSLKSAEITEE